MTTKPSDLRLRLSIYSRLDVDSQEAGVSTCLHTLKCVDTVDSLLGASVDSEDEP
jgi:hypothetical protein